MCRVSSTSHTTGRNFLSMCTGSWNPSDVCSSSAPQCTERLTNNYYIYYIYYISKIKRGQCSYIMYLSTKYLSQNIGSETKHRCRLPQNFKRHETSSITNINCHETRKVRDLNVSCNILVDGTCIVLNRYVFWGAKWSILSRKDNQPTELSAIEEPSHINGPGCLWGPLISFWCSLCIDGSFSFSVYYMSVASEV
jgi:hypothetical protein